ncbi:hypothetical protein V5O48_019167, partial [Marasmius crinis-equi]
MVHARQESTVSFASVSSYGFVLNNGVPDPFDFRLPSLQERPSSEDLSSISMSVDDTFSFLHHPSYRRQRVESDASSFYFNSATPSNACGHRRQESNMSVTSQCPPISLYNRSFGAHRRNESSASINSSLGMHGAGARNSWTRHRRGASADSVYSRFSAMQLGRPGIGDKMFDAPDYGAPLESITASPPESGMAERMANWTSYDYNYILDADQQSASAIEDSLFEKTGNRSSVDLESVFGYDDSASNQLLPPSHLRGRYYDQHARRWTRLSSVRWLCNPGFALRSCWEEEASTGSKGQREGDWSCKDPALHCVDIFLQVQRRAYDSGDKGLLERQSLEESVLMAEGEDLSISLGSMPVFSRPAPTSRSRSSTCTSLSSGAETPPFSASDGSSASKGSQS